MEDCRSKSLSGFRIGAVRKESTTTTAGLAFSTSLVISSKPPHQVLSRHTWLRLIKWDGVGQLGRIEGCVLLLISQHLDGGFTEDSE